MSHEPRPAKAAPTRRPYEPPAIKFEKKIEAFAVACTCQTNFKQDGLTLDFTGIAYCGADNFS